MKCKVKLYHLESSTKWSVKKEFGYDTKNAGWTKNKLPYERLLKYDTVTFRAQIEILSLFDLESNKVKMNDGQTVYSATKAFDDGSIGTSSSSPFRRKKKKKAQQKRSSSSASPGYNPYGGYGSHNYHHYFNDGYKRNSAMQQTPTEKKEEEENEEKDEEEDSQSYNDSEGSDGSTEEELQLKTMEEIREQVDFLSSEAKKLNKIVSTLKKKSKQNDKLIQSLKNDINALTNGNAKQQNMNQDTGDDGLLGDLFGAPTTELPQIKVTSDTLSTNNNTNGSEYGGWATF